MATIGQIVYRLDSIGQNPITMVTGRNDLNGQHDTVFQILLNGLIGTEIAGSNEIYPIPSNSKILKLGIQMPPGEHFKINESAEMIMGRTGIWELDEDIETSITQIQIIPSRNWVINEEATTDAQNAAVNAFASEEFKITQYESANGWNDSDMTAWVNKFQAANAKFNANYINYLIGKNGSYEPSKEVKNLKNVIIDYIYEPKTTSGEVNN